LLWNRLSAEEEDAILARARASPELSPREVALHIVDSEGFYVSESTVYRILKREGLIKPAEVVGFKAGKEYHHKTKGPHELWATDYAYLKVIGWGWYYLVTVMDDFSRFIIAWELQVDMTADSLIGVVQEAVGCDGDDRCTGGGQNSASLRQWVWLSVTEVRRVLETGGDPAHLRRTFAPTDKRQD